MQVNIKIEDDLYRKLAAQAKNHRRTITGELNELLSQILEKSEPYQYQRDEGGVIDWTK